MIVVGSAENNSDQSSVANQKISNRRLLLRSEKNKEEQLSRKEKIKQAQAINLSLITLQMLA